MEAHEIASHIPEACQAERFTRATSRASWAAVIALAKTVSSSTSNVSPRDMSSYAITSSPLRLTSDKSFNDGPEGFFSPRSHCETSVVGTFR